MSLSLSGLTAWTDEHKMDLIKESVLTGRTIDLVTVQGGIKNSATINRLSTTLDAQAGACGWNAAGTTTLDQRTITVYPLKWNEAICLDTLESYYTSVMMNPGSYNESIPFEQIFAENKRDQIKAYLEDLIWQGDTGGSGDLALCDGLVKLFDTDAALSPPVATTGTYTAATLATGTNAIDTVDAMIDAIPERIQDAEDLTLFLSYADFKKLKRQLRAANYYNFYVDGAETTGAMKDSFIYPDENIRVVATKGLSGQNRMILTPASNIVVGTDLLSDAEDFSIFYDKSEDEVRFRAKAKIGVNVAWMEDVLYYTGV